VSIVVLVAIAIVLLNLKTLSPAKLLIDRLKSISSAGSVIG